MYQGRGRREGLIVSGCGGGEVGTGRCSNEEESVLVVLDSEGFRGYNRRYVLSGGGFGFGERERRVESGE